MVAYKYNKGDRMANIVFTDIHNPEGVLEKPRPASEYIPQWYKDAKSYLDPSGKKAPTVDGSASSTIKRCMPVWDIMTAGYIIETPYDIYIRQTADGPYFQWGAHDTIAFQNMEQFQNHPYSRDINYAVRIVIPWSIKTPKGWSILVMEPQHREIGPITCASGIVDTDDYSIPFNMFLKLRDPEFEGLIPAGTPLLQVIPFKRESWESFLGGNKEREKFDIDKRKFNRLLFDKYKKFWWNKKEYK
jgi:hypothetical protein